MKPVCHAVWTNTLVNTHWMPSSGKLMGVELYLFNKSNKNQVVKEVNSIVFAVLAKVSKFPSSNTEWVIKTVDVQKQR